MPLHRSATNSFFAFCPDLAYSFMIVGSARQTNFCCDENERSCFVTSAVNPRDSTTAYRRAKDFRSRRSQVSALPVGCRCAAKQTYNATEPNSPSFRSRQTNNCHSATVLAGKRFKTCKHKRLRGCDWGRRAVQNVDGAKCAVPLNQATTLAKNVCGMTRLAYARMQWSAEHPLRNQRSGE